MSGARIIFSGIACILQWVLVAALWAGESPQQLPPAPVAETCEGASHAHDEDDLRVMMVRVEGVEKCTISYIRPMRGEAGVLYPHLPGLYRELTGAGPMEQGTFALKKGDLGTVMYCGACHQILVFNRIVSKGEK